MKLPESDAKSRRQRFLDASNRSLKSVEYSVERSYNHSISDNDRFGFENEQKMDDMDDDFFYQEPEQMNFDNAYFDDPNEFDSKS